MIELLQKLFLGHVHRYKIIKVIEIYDSNTTEGELPVGTRYILQCKKCGKIRSKRT